MYWEDFLIDRPLSVPELSAWLEDVFDVSEAQVLVQREDETTSVSPEVRVLSWFDDACGEFPFHIRVFTHDNSLDSIRPEPAIEKLSREHSVRALVSDDTPNPYRMILVEPSGSRTPVHLDMDALDEEDCFMIAKVGDDDSSS